MHRHSTRRDSEWTTGRAVETMRPATRRWTSVGGHVTGLVLLALLVTTGGVWAQEATARVSASSPTPPTLTRAQQHQRHQALWTGCRSGWVEAPPGPARAVAVDGAPPRAVSPYCSVALEGQPAVAVVEGRIAAVTPGTTTDGRGVFTDYELVVTRVEQDSVLLPVAVGATVLITRPGGEGVRGGVRRVVSVAGYPRLQEGEQVVVTLIAISEVGSYQKVSLRPAGGKGGRP
jgi:hypothetical protein